MAETYDKATPAMMTAEFLMGSLEAAEELDFDITPSLARNEISIRQVRLGEGYLPIHRVVDFLNHAAESAGCEDFCLRIARHQPPGRFAMVGQIIRFAPDLGAAIEDAITFSVLNSEFSEWELSREPRTVSLIRRVRFRVDAAMLQMRTLAMAVNYKAINALCGRRIPLQQVTFDLERPSIHAQVEQYFQAPVLYNSPETSLCMAPSVLQTPIPTADEKVRELLKAHLGNLAAEKGEHVNLKDRLRHQLRQTLGSRHCNLEGISHAWGIHPRALQRKLRREGLAFREVLGEVRLDISEEYLRHTTISVAHLSRILGYRNASAFSRAFKARSGYPPERWRQLRRSDGITMSQNGIRVS